MRLNRDRLNRDSHLLFVGQPFYRLETCAKIIGDCPYLTYLTYLTLLLEMCREEQVTLLLVTHDERIAERCETRFDCSGLIVEAAR